MLQKTLPLRLSIFRISMPVIVVFFKILMYFILNQEYNITNVFADSKSNKGKRCGISQIP